MDAGDTVKSTPLDKSTAFVYAVETPDCRIPLTTIRSIAAKPK